MKLDAAKFGLAWAITLGIFRIICSALVLLMPGMMMGVSGHMVHGDLSAMRGQLSLVGVLVGLVAGGRRYRLAGGGLQHTGLSS